MIPFKIFIYQIFSFYEKIFLLKKLYAILNKLLIEDPNERISWEDYFNHKFFKDNKKEKEISKSKEKHIDIKNGDKDKKENVTLKFKYLIFLNLLYLKIKRY